MPRLRGVWIAVALSAVLCAACSRERGAAAQASGAAIERDRTGSVTISGDDSLAARLTWQVPAVAVDEANAAAGLKRAGAALAEGRLYEDADSAIPLYLALRTWSTSRDAARAGLERALRALLADGERALADAGDVPASRHRAERIAAVARTIAAEDPRVVDYLQRVDLVERVWLLNEAGDRALAAGEYGEAGGGALAAFREAKALAPGQARAAQGLAAVESGLIRRAEDAAQRADFEDATRWLLQAARVRPEDGIGTVGDAEERVARLRA
ncbi:MAG: formylglycine-generating enzyme family protein, partial [Luteimonas sp.]|nr:formylglycine-generating enzyme family protein [Luteimonas sp.]